MDPARNADSDIQPDDERRRAEHSAVLSKNAVHVLRGGNAHTRSIRVVVYHRLDGICPAFAAYGVFDAYNETARRYPKGHRDGNSARFGRVGRFIVRSVAHLRYYHRRFSGLFHFLCKDLPSTTAKRKQGGYIINTVFDFIIAAAPLEGAFRKSRAKIKSNDNESRGVSRRERSESMIITI